MALETNVTELVNVHKFDIVHGLNFLHQFVRYILFLVKLMDPVPIVSVICDCSSYLIILINKSQLMHATCRNDRFETFPFVWNQLHG